jgi:hypothetical protein
LSPFLKNISDNTDKRMFFASVLRIITGKPNGMTTSCHTGISQLMGD